MCESDMLYIIRLHIYRSKIYFNLKQTSFVNLKTDTSKIYFYLKKKILFFLLGFLGGEDM